ncbi:cyclic nucleotide-binding domain protein (macronuclear) [Tetrahymena thermophila SB210]|uniref:Cyclic nucleotide-binding domain protein n=1 Tax=Tetrahymena thermophila (strain SB210) TaxID=312017 RepID=I7M4G5_TETTS|nr:cyclic nucleotide-binding domain protein [Tetrahymena thermophila SB210]EAS06997.2 cyclic nucleotide-binding domain protein [Tetrahymena thermophila SB210]|eukprot:XP_001027239.2 cyclic nucleotide-binding domain protein [Tetrahymena thermophila SB210]
MSLSSFQDVGEIGSHNSTKNQLKLQKIQSLFRGDSRDLYKQSSSIANLDMVFDILQRDPLLRTIKEIEYIIKQFSGINFLQNYLQDGCKSLIKAVIERSTIYHFSEGEFIYRKGDDSNFLYIVLQGDVGIYGQVLHQKNTANNTLIKVLSSGDTLGNIEMTLNMKRFFSAQALNLGTLIKIDKVTFNRYLRDVEEQKLDADFNFLENIQIFKGWSRDDLINIYIDCISQKYKYQEQVYTYGQPSQFIYIVKTGQFSIFKQKPLWFKHDVEQLQNGVMNNQSCIKIGKLNVLDIFGYDDIFLNSKRMRKVTCDSHQGGELLVISKHNFIASILSHQPIKNYLLQKTKSDYFKPSKFIDDKPTAIMGDNDNFLNQNTQQEARQRNIKMSIINLSEKSTPKRGLSDNKKNSQSKQFAKTFYQFKNQSVSYLPSVNQFESGALDKEKEGQEEKSVRVKYQPQTIDSGNPLSHKKLPFLSQLKDKQDQGDQESLKLIIKENYFNRASAAYAHLFSHKLDKQNKNTDLSKKKTEINTSQQSIQSNIQNNVTNNSNSQDQSRIQIPIQESPDYNNLEKQDHQKQYSNNSARGSNSLIFESPVKPRNLAESQCYSKNSPLQTESNEINSPQKSFERFQINKKQIYYSQFNSREDLDSLKQNHLFLSNKKFGNSLSNLQQFEDLWPISSKNMLDNKYLNNISPLSSHSFKKLMPIQLQMISNN